MILRDTFTSSESEFEDSLSKFSSSSDDDCSLLCQNFDDISSGIVDTRSCLLAQYVSVFLLGQFLGTWKRCTRRSSHHYFYVEVNFLTICTNSGMGETRV